VVANGCFDHWAVLCTLGTVSRPKGCLHVFSERWRLDGAVHGQPPSMELMVGLHNDA
jgi:hypothetical protein